MVNELILLLMIKVVPSLLSLSERRGTRWTGLTDYNEILLTDLPHQHATERRSNRGINRMIYSELDAYLVFQRKNAAMTVYTIIDI